jgi:uncharacterized protein
MASIRRDFFAQISLLGAQPRLASRDLTGRLMAELERMEVISSHEHIRPEEARLAMKLDFFDLAWGYLMQDIFSAGLTGAAHKVITDKNAPLADRWKAFETHWNHVRWGGYAQAFRIAIRDIYGQDEISAATLPKINSAIAARNKKGIYRYVLRDRGRIKYSVVDDNWNPAPVKLDPEFFVPARKFDIFITPGSRQDLQNIEKLTGVSVNGVKGLKQAMETSFEQSIAVGMAAVKSLLAYERELLFQEVSEPDAERDFEAMASGSRKLPEGFRRHRARVFRNLEDHMFHHLIRLADTRGYPVQIHTGLFAGLNFITNSNPALLTNTFLLYPRVKFDLLHMSYPYQEELAVLAKTFPNVHIDLCWAHIVAPGATRRALHEFLEMVPVNKIMGFGGDYRLVELSYGSLVVARRNIAQVLAERVEEGFCTETEAVDIGRMLLHDNVAALFPRRA